MDSTNSGDTVRVRLPRPASDRKRVTAKARRTPATRRPMLINLIDDDDVGVGVLQTAAPQLSFAGQVDAVEAPRTSASVHCASRDNCTFGRESADGPKTAVLVAAPSTRETNGGNAHRTPPRADPGNHSRAGTVQCLHHSGHTQTITTLCQDADPVASRRGALSDAAGVPDNDKADDSVGVQDDEETATGVDERTGETDAVASDSVGQRDGSDAACNVDHGIAGDVGDDSDDSDGSDDGADETDDSTESEKGDSDDSSDAYDSRDGGDSSDGDDGNSNKGEDGSDSNNHSKDDTDDNEDDDADDEFSDSRSNVVRPRQRRGAGARADAATGSGVWMRARVPPSQRVPLDEALVDKAQRNVLTVEDLDGADPTVALRLATVDAARPIVERWWGYVVRGLPMAAGPDPDAPYALLPHQVHAMRWMRAREALQSGRVYGVSGGILSLRMGMGKTLTALAHILSAPRGEMPTLVLCSARVLQEWHASGVAKFFGATDADGAPLVRALYFHRDYMSPVAMRAIDRRALAAYDIVLTTYDMCLAECRRGHYDEDCLERGPKGRVTAVHARARSRADRPDLVGGAVLYGTLWERIVCDESQRFANPTTSIYRAVMALYGRYKWCLTGTPIRNSHTDIWAQMRFLGYTGIASRAVWKRDGPTFYTRHRLSEAVLVMGYDDAHCIGDNGDRVAPSSPTTPSPLTPSARSTAPVTQQTLDTRTADKNRDADSMCGPTIAPAAPRNATTTTRSTAVALPRLPPIHHREVIVTLSVPERQTYDAVLALARTALDGMRAQAGNFGCVLSMFTRLRQVAVAAYLMTLGDGTSTRDEIMRVLRRADESLAATGSVAPCADPGAHATSMTPGATLAMRPAPPPSSPVTVPVPTPSILASSAPVRASRVFNGPQVDPSVGPQHTITTTKTIVRPRHGTATTTTTTTTATHIPPENGVAACAAKTAGAVANSDVLRVSMPRRVLPRTMATAAPTTQMSPATPTDTAVAATTTTIEIVDDAQGDEERAADDARESGMGLAMWCLDRRSRAGIRSAKMRAITRILAQVPADEKVLVFSSFASCLDLVADAIAARLPAMGAVQIDGDLSKRERDERLRAFRAAGGPRVLLMTYKIGAEGLNLAEANHCVCVEPWWTKAVYDQAYSRCWRVGQTRPVTVYSIIVAGTMEQRVVQVCRDKSATADAYMASSASSRHAAAAASRRAGGEATLDLATLSRIIG
ncbi:SNF2 N-incomplete domain and Helicase C-domain containing protein [Pandoravirus salinus]|uniref:SNF2 N-incomplete domain and Helicase C-domain containing protein n=1 Tax=Pandoravirus salinus TaxID=1349410 RepID=S4W1D3_9VIRU|nr:SNF2 N-incomplete domain and Helicase C-domain containing protein [Pandoravirus salinus]AGO84237.1 SNF2 N-incomplete domain and Helicase C-domain containing protein [Pandoravirus salinus]